MSLRHETVGSYQEGQRQDVFYLSPSHSDDTLTALSTAIRASQGFREAARLFCESMASFRLGGPRRINKLVSQDVRFRTVIFTLYLHFRASAVLPDEGATHTRVFDLVSRSSGGGSRAVRNTLDLMKHMGLLAVESGVQNRRLRLYRPTPAMLALAKTWVERCLMPLDLIHKERRSAPRQKVDDDVLRAFVFGLGRALLADAGANPDAAALRCFFEREGGWPFLSICAREALEGRPLPSRSEIAKRFGFSKSQIAMVATEATRLGYLRTAGDGVWATDELLARYERWVSNNLALFALAAA